MRKKKVTNSTIVKIVISITLLILKLTNFNTLFSRFLCLLRIPDEKLKMAIKILGWQWNGTKEIYVE